MLFYQFWVHSAAFTYLLSGSNAKEGINVEDFPEFFSNHDKSGYLGEKKKFMGIIPYVVSGIYIHTCRHNRIEYFESIQQLMVPAEASGTSQFPL